MNGYQRIRAVLRHEAPDATPVMLHNFMMAAAESGVPMSRYRTDPAEGARCFIESVEKYGYDGILVDVDTATLAGAVGVPVAFPLDEPAVCSGQRLRSLAEARDLESVDIAPYPRVQAWLEAVRLLKRYFGDEVYVRGNCDQCPFSLASAVRGAADWMMDIMDPANRPDAFRLLDFCLDATNQFIRLMSATGAHMVSNGDSPAGPSLVSPRIYRTFALPYETRVVETAHAAGLPYALHICGKTEPILDDMVSTGADALEIDFKTAARKAREIIAGRAVFIGNIDPTAVIALGTSRDVEEKTRELLHIFAGEPGFILNAGCAIPATTPAENIRAMIRVARKGCTENMPIASDEQLSRRRLLQAATSITVAPLFVPARARGRGGAPAPSDRINLGIIGVNGMGRSNLENCARHPDVVVTAVCDVAQDRRDKVVELHKGRAKGHRDYRELLARSDVDAVIIASPPHWHALMAIDAVRAGKDIYLQKPMTLYPDETIAVRNAVNRHKRISQIGTQIHATSNYRRVVEWIRSGKLGPVSVVRTFNVMNQGPEGIGRAPKQPPPEGVDWDMWLGPGPARDFNPLLFADSYYHCSFWNYSRGWTPGMAPHIIDLPIWALDLGVPSVITCTGGRYVIHDDGDAPDTQEVTWRYPNLTMTWMMNCANSFAFDFGRGKPERRLGIYFHALNGTLFTDYGKHEVVPEGDLLKDPAPPPESIPPSPGHEREWLDAIKSRNEPSCSVNYHYKVDLAITLANLSYLLGRSVRFDPKTEKIIDDKEAVKLARPVYRRPWKFPAEYLGGKVTS